jgi:hypothetical protein
MICMANSNAIDIEAVFAWFAYSEAEVIIKTSFNLTSMHSLAQMVVDTPYLNHTVIDVFDHLFK